MHIDSKNIEQLKLTEENRIKEQAKRKEAKALEEQLRMGVLESDLYGFDCLDSINEVGNEHIDIKCKTKCAFCEEDDDLPF